VKTYSLAFAGITIILSIRCQLAADLGVIEQKVSVTILSQQVAQHVRVTGARRQTDRHLVVDRLVFRTRSGLDEQLHDVHVSRFGGEVKRRPAILKPIEHY